MNDPVRRIGMPISVFILGYGGFVLWVCLIVFSTLHPGKTPRQELFYVHLVFGIFAVLSIYLAYFSHKSEVVWDDECITGPNWYGRPTKIFWSSMVSVTFDPLMQVVVLKDREGATIRVSQMCKGLDYLHNYINAHHPKLLYSAWN